MRSLIVNLFLGMIMLTVLLLPTSYAMAADTARTTFYVDNVNGNDTYDGLSAIPQAGGISGPFATIMQAVRKATVGATISIANTGTPYRESINIEGYNKGRAATPLVIEGNGACVSGLVEVPAARWTHLHDDIYWFENKLPDGKKGPMPNNNWFIFLKHQGWFDSPQTPAIFFVDGTAAPSVTSLGAIPTGGFFYDTQASPRRLYFRLPANKMLEQVKIEIPLNGGVYIGDDYVVVRNLGSMYSREDGFDGFWGIGVVFENIYGAYNCEQGFSMHGNSVTLVDGGLFERNGGVGIVDVMSSTSIYRNVVIRNNAIAGALLQGYAHSLSGCRAYGNEGTQISSSHNASLIMTNCLVIGDGLRTGVDMETGRLDRVTIVNCGTGLRIWRNAAVTSSIITNCTKEVLSIAKDGSYNINKSLLELGTAVFGEKKVTKEQWSEFVAGNKQISDIAVDAPALEGPLFLLPKDSPYISFGQSGMTPGAKLPAETPWQAVNALQ